MFHPNLGRWLQNDPIGFEGGDTNLYRYEHNAPANSNDPLGLSDTERRIWICSTYYKDWKATSAYMWHSASATLDMVNPFCDTDHTIKIRKPQWDKGAMAYATSKMLKRGLLGPGNKITFLEFSCHGFEFRKIIPEEFLGEDIDIITRQYRRLVSAEVQQPLTAQRRDELWQKASQFLRDNRTEIEEFREALRPIAGCLGPDAEIRINACEQGKRHDMMKAFARQMGARVCANDGSIAGTGTGTWWITDRIGSTCEKDKRWGSYPNIGKSLISISTLGK